MGRPKGGTNEYWLAEEKYKIIKPIIEFEKSSSQVTKETGINNGMLSIWVKKYNENVIDGLKPKKKPGNPLAKYSSRKEFNETEKLELEIMKLKIENERLKKDTL